MKIFILPQDFAVEIMNHLRKSPTGQVPYEERELLLAQMQSIREIPAEVLPALEAALKSEDEAADGNGAGQKKIDGEAGA